MVSESNSTENGEWRGEGKYGERLRNIYNTDAFGYRTLDMVRENLGKGERKKMKLTHIK